MTVAGTFDEHLRVFQEARATLLPSIEAAIAGVTDSLAHGGKVLVCGNGGSAADAQHFAAELVGRFVKERRGLPGIALTTDTSALTAIANDYGYDEVFARQVEGLARRGDVLIAISTSGNSKNVVRAAARAKELGCSVIALTGATGGVLAPMCDVAVLVPSNTVARIQEVHELVLHSIAEGVDEAQR
jgi:D-sedoheptulose 7-phosphate isomerase